MASRLGSIVRLGRPLRLAMGRRRDAWEPDESGQVLEHLAGQRFRPARRNSPRGNTSYTTSQPRAGRRLRRGAKRSNSSICRLPKDRKPAKRVRHIRRFGRIRCFGCQRVDRNHRTGPSGRHTNRIVCSNSAGPRSRRTTAPPTAPALRPYGLRWRSGLLTSEWLNRKGNDSA